MQGNDAALAGGRSHRDTVRERRDAPRWTRWGGVLLLTIAASAALDPEYPAARGRYPAAGQRSVTEALPPEAVPLPVVLRPSGAITAARPHFEWSYGGPPADFDVVLLDDALDEVWRGRAPARRFLPDGDLLQALAHGRRFHWFVEGSLQGRRFRSAPAAFAFSH